jgi:glycerophosphoryl diester phosphodiesterase
MTAESTSPSIPQLIAHRGYALRYPENSLEAMEAALKLGAKHVEFDIHLSADGVPVVIHDAELTRTAGVEGTVSALSAEDLSKLEVNEHRRLGDAFSGIQIPTLKQMVTLLETWPRVTAFVELKRASLDQAGVEAMVQRVLEVLKPITERCTLISFNDKAVALARQQGATSIGWVLENWDGEVRRSAEELAPDYLFCNQELLPAEAKLWPGPWRWVVYEISDAELALQLASRGVDFIETMAIGELLDDPRLRPEGRG